MKAVVYNVKPFENEFLAKANKKKHDITLISNLLNTDTVMYAAGKNTVIVTEGDQVNATIIEKLAGLGVRYLVTRSVEINHIDKETALTFGLKLANLPFYSPLPKNAQANADQVIRNLDEWELNKCFGNACVCAKDCATEKNLKTK
jgi:lactate dehydrogenase-like 2-hydroxyacid dehydrogenase